MFWKKREPVPVMTAVDLARLVTGESPPVIVDVRSPQQFHEAHLPGAINIPLSELEHRAGELDPAAPTVFY
jgi:rhodanese-related sulfurtransferase